MIEEAILTSCNPSDKNLLSLPKRTAPRKTALSLHQSKGIKKTRGIRPRESAIAKLSSKQLVLLMHRVCTKVKVVRFRSHIKNKHLKKNS